jgi:hypothetical protein
LKEIEDLHKKYPNRPKAAREAIILKVQKEEIDTFTQFGLSTQSQVHRSLMSCIGVPDVTRKANTEKLRKWNGDYKFLNNVPMKAFKPEMASLTGSSTPTVAQNEMVQ